MKKLFIFCLLAVNFAFAQQTDSWLNSEADTIRLETLPGHNTAKRVGRMFKNLVSSKLNVGSLSSYTFTSGTAGTVPASGGGTSTYLRADGTWATLPSSTLPANANGVLYNNGSGIMSWPSALNNLLSASGASYQIPFYNGGGGYGFIPAGASGQTLVISGGVPTWTQGFGPWNYMTLLNGWNNGGVLQPRWRWRDYKTIELAGYIYANFATTAQLFFTIPGVTLGGFGGATVTKIVGTTTSSLTSLAIIGGITPGINLQINYAIGSYYDISCIFTLDSAN